MKLFEKSIEDTLTDGRRFVEILEVDSAGFEKIRNYLKSVTGISIALSDKGMCSLQRAFLVC